eukprot:764212-Hanusia_phi.AAC.3
MHRHAFELLSCTFAWLPTFSPHSRWFNLLLQGAPHLLCMRFPYGQSVFYPLTLASAPLLYGGFLKRYPGSACCASLSSDSDLRNKIFSSASFAGKECHAYARCRLECLPACLHIWVREDNETARLYDSLPFSPFASSLIIRANMLYIYPVRRVLIATTTHLYLIHHDIRQSGRDSGSIDVAKIQLAASFPDLVPQRSLFVDAVLAEQNAKQVSCPFPLGLRYLIDDDVQAVILGAGFDMRAYGQHGKKMKFFEVDFEVTQTAKLDSLVETSVTHESLSSPFLIGCSWDRCVRCEDEPIKHVEVVKRFADISFVSVDVRNEEWVDQLLKVRKTCTPLNSHMGRKSGFTKDAQTIFILEGLIYYLQKDKVRQLFDFASECAQGYDAKP